MTAARGTAQERTVDVLGLNIRMLEGGTGSPLVVIHHDIGNDGWLPVHERLAGSNRVLVPDLPGYGASDRPAWARHPRDLAVTLNLLLDKLEIDGATLLGLGYGGWIAAEMATMNQRRLRRLVLVNAFGIKPLEGEIADQMLMDLIDYVRLGFARDEDVTTHFGDDVARETVNAWDLAREMTARVAWKPYMFSHQLPHTLAGVTLPTLIVWGAGNRIVPSECGAAFLRAMPNARMEVIEGAGHWLEREQPDALAQLVEQHLA